MKLAPRATIYRYCGAERDDETGFYMMGARYYCPWLGRWTTADPLGLQAGINLYLYCRAGPVVFSDPSGTEETRADDSIAVQGERVHLGPAPAAHNLDQDPFGQIGRGEFHPPDQARAATGVETGIFHTGLRVSGLARAAGDAAQSVLGAARARPLAPGESAGPNAVDQVGRAMVGEYRAAGGGLRGIRNALNVLNPFYQAPKEIGAAYQANQAGDYSAAGEHTFGATAGLVGATELGLGAIPKGPTAGEVAGVAVTDSGVEVPIPSAQDGVESTTSQSSATPGGGSGSGSGASASGTLGERIAGGHAFDKHVVKRQEYAGLGIATRDQFAAHIDDVVKNATGANVRNLSNGRTAYWDPTSGTVVISNPAGADASTAFRPDLGERYFTQVLR